MRNKSSIFKLSMIFLAIVAFVAFSSTPVLCEDQAASSIIGDDDVDSFAGDVERAPDLNFGTSNFVSYAVAPHEFIGWDATYDSYVRQSVSTRYCSSACTLDAGIHLPQGARLWGVELDYYDSGASNFSVAIIRIPWNATGGTQVTSVSSANAGGIGIVTKTDINHTIDNYNNTYIFEAYLPGTSAYRILGIRTMHYLQISPAPGSATFYDVPTGHWAFQKIEALARSGITVGCGGGAFCPDAPVTRAQMAVFLSKALGLHYPG